MARPFLTTRWQNLIVLSYAVPDEVLAPRLPSGLELDRHAGSAWVSLVALEFVGTRVLGVGWPGYRDFPEINLRYYVRDGDRRGVVFIRELVPLRAVALIARSLYNEPYRAVPVRSRHGGDVERFEIEYRVQDGGGEQRVQACGSRAVVRPPQDSVEHFFKEHPWGFGVDARGTTRRYEVQHPVWDLYPLLSHELSWDWGAVYGTEWAFLTGRPPDHAMFAVGSVVEVYPQG